MNDGPLDAPDANAPNAGAGATPRTARPARPRSLACPNCGGPIAIRASGISITAACPACGAVLDVANEDVRLITTAQASTRTPLIAIGTRGTLCGTEWEVVGYQERSSEGGTWQWEEYLLFNPYRGFRFLGRDHGTWTLYAMLRETVSDDGRVAGDRRHYRLETTTTARTDYVLGEFYWRVKAGDTVAVREFVARPYVLSEERGGDEVTWSRGVVIDDATVRAAFRLQADAPEATGAQAGAQAGAPGRPVRHWQVAAVAVGLLLVLQMIGFGSDHDRLVFKHRFIAHPADMTHTLASEPFDLPDRGGNVTLDVVSSAGYDWLDIGLALVTTGATTGATTGGDHRFDAHMWIERYRAQTLRSVTFASVPGGSYKLLATINQRSFTKMGADAAAPSADPAAAASQVEFTVSVRRHTLTFSYFMLALGLILAWPVIAWVWHGWRRLTRKAGT